MTDNHNPSVVRVKREPNATDATRMPNSSLSPVYRPCFSRLPLNVLDIIVSCATETGDAKLSNRALLACALTCLSLLRPAHWQAQLYRTVVLSSDPEQLSAFSSAIYSNLALGPLVKTIQITYEAVTPTWPLPAHIVGRLSNLQQVDLSSALKHRMSDTSFMRLFAAPSQSLKSLTIAHFGCHKISDVVHLVWSFPALETLFLQQCAWGTVSTNVFPDPGLYPAHCSRLTTLKLWLDSPALSPLPLTMFGTTLTVLEVDVVPTYVSPLDYKGLSGLKRLQMLTLRVTRNDVTIVPRVLSSIRSPDLLLLFIVHRVQEQTIAGTVKQLETLNPKLQDVLTRPMFWTLRAVSWSVRCETLPADADQMRWKTALAPFLQVMADRNILVLTVDERPKIV